MRRGHLHCVLFVLGLSSRNVVSFISIPSTTQSPNAVSSIRAGTITKSKPQSSTLHLSMLSKATPPSSSVDVASTLKTRVKRKYDSYQWRHEGSTYNINYRAEGPIDAPPMLLVHGFGANINHFRFQFANADLTRLYRVYAIDLLGFGASDKPGDANYSIELFAQLLVDFMTHWQSKKPWIICGNSIGGLTCLSAAVRLPSMIQGVVLFNCAGGMTGFRYEDVPAWVRPILYFVQTVVLGPYWGGRFFSNFKTRENIESILRTQGVYCDTRNVNDELIEILLRPSDDDGAEQVFLKVFAGPPGPTPESILPLIECPILGLWGDSDPWTPVDRGVHPGVNFGQYCSKFELNVLPGCGHCPHDEAPEAVHQIMTRWLNDTAALHRPSSSS